MLSLAAAALAYVVCIGFFIWAVAVAPPGYEDDTGFHFGEATHREDKFSDRPSYRRPRARRDPGRHLTIGHH